MTTTDLVVVPWLMGYKTNHYALLFPQFDKVRVHFTEPVPGCRTQDLGQDQCMAQLEETMTTVLGSPAVERVVIVGESQGTATVVNWMATARSRGTSGLHKVAGLILISVLVSGNLTAYDMIRPCCRCCSSCGATCTKMVAAVPVCTASTAKICCFPGYDPRSASQPLHRCLDLPRDIPVILINSRYDRDGTPLDGARALWTRIYLSRDTSYDETRKDRRVYLLTVEGSDHLYPVLHKETASYDHGGGMCFNTKDPDYPDRRFLYTFRNLHRGLTDKKTETWYRLHGLLQHVGLPSALSVDDHKVDLVETRMTPTPDDLSSLTSLIELDCRVDRYHHRATRILRFFFFLLFLVVVVLYLRV